MNVTKFVTRCLFGLATVAMASDEKPLGELKPEVFINLIEGVDKLNNAPQRASMPCYTGLNVESAFVRAKFGQASSMDWVSAAVPISLAQKRVTFVIPVGLGGEGGQILDVPFQVSVNGKPAVTIHSSVKGSTYWKSGEAHALFVHLYADQFGDPFGLLLLSVPPGTVAPGKAAILKVDPKPAQTDGSFFTAQYSLGNVAFVEKSGGVAKLLTTDVAGPAPKKEESQPVVERKALVEMAGLRDDSVCLTGNATGDQAARNGRVEGRYTYYDGRTDWYYFPHFSPFLPPGRDTNVDEYPNRAGGWVTFAEGKLTDGDPNSKTGWPVYLQTSVGMDIVFDLGAEHAIDQVEGNIPEKHLRNMEIILKSEAEPRWTTVQALADRASHIRAHFPKFAEPVPVLPIGGMNARYVRVRAAWKSQAALCGFSELRIWGRPTSGAKIAKKPLLQLGGKVAVANPGELPIALPDPPVLPVPQEMKTGKGEFVITSATSIVLLPGTSERTRRTAEILAQDWKDEFGLDVKVLAIQSGEKPPKNSIVVRSTSWERNSDHKPQAYSMSITPDRVEVRGDDEQGTFYATQTLLLLARPKSATEFALPVATIRDWPDKPVRLFGIGSIPPTVGFLKALARFKVTHFNLYNAEHFPAATALNEAARDRFLQYVPVVDFCNAWQPKPNEWAERPADEPFEKLNPGRINPCPSHPDMWASYFAGIDGAVGCHGEYININMDEMYIPDYGSRWNVCPRCRARNLTGHDLMADTIEKIDAYLRSKGKKTMVIDSPIYSGGISHPGDNANDWRKAADILSKKGLSKDMIVWVWHGEELAKRLKGLGFSVLLHGRNAPREPVPAVYDGFYLNMGDGQFQAPEILGTLTTIWSPQHGIGGSETTDVLIEEFMPVFKRAWTAENLPSRRAGAEFFAIDLRKAANRTFTDQTAGDGKGWADLGPNYDLRALKPGKREFAGVPFEILDSAVTVHNRWAYNRELPERIAIPVGRPAASLSFLHTLDSNMGVCYWTVKELAGYYYVVYDDGTYEPIELKNAVNITKFDGLSDFWDSAPRGKGMVGARLVWRGQTGSGNEAYLYKMEWVNPFPRKKIDRIIFASPKQVASANPILIAATGVVPTIADEASAPKPRYEFGPRRIELLSPPLPIGNPIDLTKGREEDEGRVWRTDDGITLELADKPRNNKSLDLTQPPWLTIGNVVYENGQNCGIVSAYEASMKIVFPQPRKLAGIRLSGQYRDTIGQQVNRPPNIYQYSVSVIENGEAAHTVSRDAHIPDEEGPLWLPLDGRAVSELRIQQTRNKPGIAATELGIDFIELYENGR